MTDESNQCTLLPKVSVIVPTYNRKRFIGKAIDSILHQTFTDYEIIVIDDGSTDGSAKMLQAYSNQIKYIYQENSGVSSARNVGIRAARGEWVAFLDSDDEWNEKYLASQTERIKEAPYAVAHIANAITIHQNGEERNLFIDTRLLSRFKGKSCLVCDRPLGIVVKHGPWFLQSTIIRRDTLFEAGLFDRQLSISEDMDVIARVALKGAFTISSNVLVKVIKREEALQSLTAQYNCRCEDRYQSFCSVYEKLLRQRGLLPKEILSIRRQLSSNYRALGNVYIVAGNMVKARKSYGKSYAIYWSIKSIIKYAATFLVQDISRALIRKT